MSIMRKMDGTGWSPVARMRVVAVLCGKGSEIRLVGGRGSLYAESTAIISGVDVGLFAC